MTSSLVSKIGYFLRVKFYLGTKIWMLANCFSDETKMFEQSAITVQISLQIENIYYSTSDFTRQDLLSCIRLRAELTYVMYVCPDFVS